MIPFLDKVRAYGRAHGLWQEGDRLLVAVSGGPDSLALLVALHTLSSAEGFALYCCTVNHHLRKEAANEATFVQSVCRELGVTCTVKHADVPAWRSAHGESEETAARILRYEALRSAAKEAGCSKIAAAHHRDDQAETVLYHLLRGSGSAGLAGMRPVNGDIIRPFLCVTRQEINKFLKTLPWEPCHDETNDVPNAMRNRLRLLLLPELRRYNPRISDALCRMAEIMASENDYIEAETEKLEMEVKAEGELLWTEAALWKALPDALARRLLRRIWLRCGGKTPEFEEMERLRPFLCRAVSGKWTSAAGTVAKISGGRVLFYPGSTRAGSAPPSRREAWELVRTVILQKPESLGENELLLDADVVGTVTLRFPKVGDVFAPLGFSGTKKLFPYMRDLGIPADQRASWPLAADEDRVYWIGGKKVSRYGRPTADTKNYLLLTLRRKCDGTPDEGH